MRKLKQALEEAKAQGKKVGKFKVTTRFTYTPTGGTANAKRATYSLKLK